MKKWMMERRVWKSKNERGDLTPVRISVSRSRPVKTTYIYTEEPKHHDHKPNILLLQNSSVPPRNGLFRTPEGVLRCLAPNPQQQIPVRL